MKVSVWLFPGRIDVEVCCTDFASAVREGSDHERYGSAIVFSCDGWSVGDVPKLVFCPWCGTRLTPLSLETKESQ